MSSESQLRVQVEGAVLAGSLWQPSSGPRSIVLMIPGSGPSDRHNDGFFEPIREHLVATGHAVAAFDKRSVGASSGRLIDTSIETQRADATSCLAQLRTVAQDVPLGVFGHSQGGWVAYETAASDSTLSFVVSNSGPSVGPAGQERVRILNLAPDEDKAGLGASFDKLIDAARRHATVDQALAIIQADAEFGDQLSGYVNGTPERWTLESTFLRYEPTAALASLDVPTLVIHGQHDKMIPVDDSLEALARIANPSIESVVLQGDHRLLDSAGNLVSGYLGVLSSFIDGQIG